MTFPIVIREAAPNEADVLSALALRSKAHWRYSEEFIASCKDELTYRQCQIESDGLDFAVAETQTTIVGFYVLEKVGRAAFELDALFVEPDYIGKGIGRLLVVHALKKVATSGGESLLIQGDPNADGFYLALGGERVGSRESGSIPGRMLPLFRIAV